MRMSGCFLKTKGIGWSVYRNLTRYAIDFITLVLQVMTVLCSLEFAGEKLCARHGVFETCIFYPIGNTSFIPSHFVLGGGGEHLTQLLAAIIYSTNRVELHLISIFISFSTWLAIGLGVRNAVKFLIWFWMLDSRGQVSSL